MTDYKNEYQKFADDAVRSREKEEAFGRLRIGIFWGVAGALAIFLSHMLKWEPVPRWAAIAMVGTAPLAVVMLIVNFIRMPNVHKSSPQAIMIGFITIIAAGATIALANVFELFKIISP
jgi:membrane associated rhomboid family serine protease